MMKEAALPGENHWPKESGRQVPRFASMRKIAAALGLEPTDIDEFRAAMHQEILPALRAFEPELVIVSAGFDAHRDDPLAELRLTEADYAWATQKRMEIADQSAQGRLVSLLEGGYDLQGLANSVAAHVIALMRG